MLVLEGIFETGTNIKKKKMQNMRERRKQLAVLEPRILRPEEMVSLAF